jgi:signal transduction histidine kinase
MRVHGIISSHNGSIAVDSSPASGTRFDIKFPVHVENNQGKD